MSLYDHIKATDPALANDIKIWADWLDRINIRRNRHEPIGKPELDAFKTHWQQTNRAISHTGFAQRTTAHRH